MEKLHEKLKHKDLTRTRTNLKNFIKKENPIKNKGFISLKNTN